MKDLIDRDALGVGPANPEVFKNTAYADGWNALLRIINQAPAVDAAPVVHGKWKPDPYCYHVFHCSVCDSPFWAMRAYCPNCGAKMNWEGDAECQN